MLVNADLRKLTSEIKEKIKTVPINEKVKLLTFTPSSWTIEETSNYFNVSKYLVKKARKLKDEKGLMAESVRQKSGNILSENLKQKIDFYQDSEFSRMCRGKKEFVSVKIDGEKKHIQKQLLLVNLKELYLEFLKRNNQSLINV